MKPTSKPGSRLHGFVDNEPRGEVVNDSLRAVDPADSDGLDQTREWEVERDDSSGISS
jgi:hypothetical protein